MHACVIHCWLVVHISLQALRVLHFSASFVLGLKKKECCVVTISSQFEWTKRHACAHLSQHDIVYLYNEAHKY